MYDIVIIGCGPAGMTSAIYAARAGKRVLVLDKEGVGGQIAKSPLVENFPGFSAISGSDLAFSMFDQMGELGVEYNLEEVLGIEKQQDSMFLVKTDRKEYSTKSIIVASGANPVELNVPGGREYIGNGVYYCVVCDGPLFADKDVLVIGSGNSGAQYAVELAGYCSSVTICDVTNAPCCEEMLKDKIISNSKITLKLPAKVTNILRTAGGKMLAEFEDGSQVMTDGIFVAIGQRPSTKFLQKTIKLSDKEYVEAKENVYTSVEGIFVAGDCRVKNIRQAVAAAGDGAEAAIVAVKYINTLEG